MKNYLAEILITFTTILFLFSLASTKFNIFITMLLQYLNYALLEITDFTLFPAISKSVPKL